MLSANAVTVSFGGLYAVQHVTFNLDQSEVVGLIGPNGAGKTTLLNVVTGFERKATGSVQMDGNELIGRSPDAIARRGLARTFQSARLFSGLTVLENLEIAALASGKRARPARHFCKELLRLVGGSINCDQAAGSLPYGIQRRLGVVRALALSPRYVLLDEPASGLNEEECEALGRLIRTIPSQTGAGVLVIEHNMSLIMAISERIYVLNNGRNLAEGTPDQIRNNTEVRRAYLGTSDG